jgi:hypothetical protein
VGRDIAAAAAASGDMILAALAQSAPVERDVTASSADIAALLSRGELHSAVVAAAKE